MSCRDFINVYWTVGCQLKATAKKFAKYDKEIPGINVDIKFGECSIEGWTLLAWYKNPSFVDTDPCFLDEKIIASNSVTFDLEGDLLGENGIWNVGFTLKGLNGESRDSVYTISYEVAETCEGLGEEPLANGETFSPFQELLVGLEAEGDTQVQRVIDEGASYDLRITQNEEDILTKQEALGFTPEKLANKGVASGYAGLGVDGKIPTSQLPSYVDDVLEYSAITNFPVIGEQGKIYVAIDTNKTYRWSGSVYIYITSGAVDSVAGKTGIVTLEKSDVGLSNVDNTSDANKPISTAQQTALDLKQNATDELLETTSKNVVEAINENREQIQSCSTNIENITEKDNNVWISDDVEKKSLMVKIPKFKISDVMDDVEVGSDDDGWHPAFIVDGEVKDCIYISKYQNIVEDGRAYSLGGKDPKVYTNFDQAKAYCEAKGNGWHLMTNAEWGAIALWSKKNGTEPLGNNYCGSDNSKKHLAAVSSYISKLDYIWNNRAYKEDPLGTYWHTGRTLTGSSPKEFSHTHDQNGIFDLNGNVWEWVGGMRLQDGEIQVIPDNNAATTGIDMSSTSMEWKGVLQDGTYVTPGTLDTLKYDNTSGLPKLNVTTDAINYKNVAFKDLLAEAGIIIPTILELLSLCPSGNTGGDRAYINTEGERLPVRGGLWASTSNAGVFALSMDNVRANSRNYIGFRSAFVI